jgi:hypothetical protein
MNQNPPLMGIPNDSIWAHARKADAATRLAVREAEAAPIVAELERWMRTERERLSRHAPVANAPTSSPASPTRR